MHLLHLPMPAMRGSGLPSLVLKLAWQRRQTYILELDIEGLAPGPLDGWVASYSACVWRSFGPVSGAVWTAILRVVLVIDGSKMRVQDFTWSQSIWACLRTLNRLSSTLAIRFSLAIARQTGHVVLAERFDRYRQPPSDCGTSLAAHSIQNPAPGVLGGAGNGHAHEAWRILRQQVCKQVKVFQDRLHAFTVIA
jgi:hypothetical protein